MENEDRRAQNVRRVPVETLVEVCGLDQAVPPFEAESVEVSGRGMHVRTAYLPEVGSALVLRFEDRGREILVEGEVAWRRDDEGGGEFGIMFTALDAGSVEALRDLCGTSAAPDSDEEPEPELEVHADVEEESPAPPAAPEAGARVRLHIDGLGSPMKARVKQGTHRRVDVGSNLEFLKVGKSLEVEDAEAGERRSALIDSVTVAIDPQSQIPQLVVTLRYEGVDSTPEPMVVSDEAVEAEPSLSPPEPLTPSEISGRYDEIDQVAADDEIAEEAEAVRGAFSKMAQGAGSAMSSAGVSLAKFSGVAATGMGKLIKNATTRVDSMRGGVAEADRPRRTTAPPTGSSRFAGLRTQGAPRTEKSPQAHVEPAPKPARKKKLAAAAGAVALGVAATVFAFGGDGEKPTAEAQAPEAPAAEAAKGPEDVVAVNEHGDPVAPGAALQAEAPKSENGVTADVPLFGPTPMATMEPAPLGAPSDEEPDDVDDDIAASKVADETWDESDKKKVDPKSVQPWGRGKMKLPVIHRLRLNEPGADIQGAINPTGFTVVIPKRKVMESAAGIAKRDKRIAQVRTKNTSRGAQVAFKFKNGVPGYRVRLRKDFVEILISSPK